MATTPIKSYRFGTTAQWASGIFSRAHIDEHGHASPFAPYGREPRIFASPAGAFAPAFATDGTAFWRGRCDSLTRLDADSTMSASVPFTAPVSVSVSAAIGNARRLLIGRRVLWVASPDARSLHCYALGDFGEILRVAVHVGGSNGEVDRTISDADSGAVSNACRSGANAAIIDIADDGRDGVWMLAEQDGDAWLMHVDCAGKTVAQCRLPGGAQHLTALTYLRNTQRIMLLAEQGRALWFVGTDCATVQAPLPISSLRPCFHATHLGSDGRERIVLGLTYREGDATPWVIVTDRSGDVLDEIAIDAPINGVAASGRQLLIATAQGVRLFDAANPTDATTSHATCAFITPALHSPEIDNVRGWLRAEVGVRLPRGTMLSVEMVVTEKIAIRDEAARIAQDINLPPQVRQLQLTRVLGDWSTPITFSGKADSKSDDNADADSEQTFSVPLSSVRQPYLWLRIQLSAPPGAAMPQLLALRVLYPNRSLMQHLPAIFQNGDPKDFLRALVGVLETTTQGLDQKIASLGSLLNPASTSEAWLDHMARWLGLPWDDALDLNRKRALMACAHQIAARRGTRAGLELLLTRLFPEIPRRFRVVDMDADVKPARVGGRNCPGSVLPSLLTGLPRSAAVLNRKTMLGHARLPCAGVTEPAIVPMPGQLRIDITASTDERSAWEPWLALLIDAVVPVTVRVALRWRHAAPAWLGTTLDDALVLTGPEEARLGSHAVLGHARLVVDRAMTLTDAGIDLGFGLQ